ncbi:unnamed protein product [Diatraea saccharalis]|uniref:Protein rolling stone-like n=1 Tax=Diatraea saccharalis TaxID=40085 RepID=A0A9N9RGY0_9NEOP|nr:unnamed protein product [Diatraea saccharalis]
MTTIKKYFKEELQWRNLNLEHSRPADFYLSVWQSNRSTAPLLVLRTLLFLASLGITVTSIVLYIINSWVGFWWIYLTHWGLSVLTLATGFSVAISARCYFYGPISGEYRLPWYIKVYWVLFNIAVPLSFLITLFYWTVLFEANIEEELNHGHDVAVHGLNSLIMFILLITSSHPSRILHIYQPLVFAVVYFLFTLFYYLGGGVNRDGQPFVYPVLNWNKAGQTVGVGVVTGLLLILLYILVVSIALARDAVSRRFVKPRTSEPPEAVPLRQQGQSAV